MRRQGSLILVIQKPSHTGWVTHRRGRVINRGASEALILYASVQEALLLEVGGGVPRWKLPCFRPNGDGSVTASNMGIAPWWGVCVHFAIQEASVCIGQANYCHGRYINQSINTSRAKPLMRVEAQAFRDEVVATHLQRSLGGGEFLWPTCHHLEI